jgi:predicted outer membrane protein
LFTVEKVLKEKEDYFKKYAIQFEKDYQEANQKYKQLIEKAKIKAKTDSNVKSLLEKVNFQAIETSKELKVTFYKRFKNLV